MNSSESHRRSSVDQCRIIELPRHHHPNGTIAVVENGGLYPFDVRRVYYLYDVPSDAERGGHSHFSEQRLIIAVSGSFDVTVDDGRRQAVFRLDRPYKALYVPPGIWRVIDNFSSGSVCLALASNLYSEDDYVREYELFKQLTADK